MKIILVLFSLALLLSIFTCWTLLLSDDADLVGDSPQHEFVSDAYQNPTLSKDLKEVQEGIKRLGGSHKKQNGETFLQQKWKQEVHRFIKVMSMTNFLEDLFKNVFLGFI